MSLTARLPLAILTIGVAMGIVAQLVWKSKQGSHNMWIAGIPFPYTISPKRHPSSYIRFLWTGAKLQLGGSIIEVVQCPKNLQV